MGLDDTVDDGDVALLTGLIVDSDVADDIRHARRIREEQEIAAEKGRLHGASGRQGIIVISGCACMTAEGDGHTHERTTTMGDSELVASERPFQSMRPETSGGCQESSPFLVRQTAPT